MFFINEVRPHQIGEKHGYDGEVGELINRLEQFPNSVNSVNVFKFQEDRFPNRLEIILSSDTRLEIGFDQDGKYALAHFFCGDIERLVFDKVGISQENRSFQQLKIYIFNLLHAHHEFIGLFSDPQFFKTKEEEEEEEEP